MQPRFDGRSATDRVREQLDIAFFNNDFDPVDLYADVSQCLRRHPWGRGEMPCLTTTSCIYSFQQQRAFDHPDIAATMGFPAELPYDCVSPRALRLLVGESFFLPSISSVLAAYYCLGGPWLTK